MHSGRQLQRGTPLKVGEPAWIDSRLWWEIGRACRSCLDTLKDFSISSAIPFAKAEQGSVMTDAGRMTEDEFMRSPIRCGGPIVTDPHGPSSPSSRGGGQ